MTRPGSRAVLHMANHCDVGGNVLLAVDLACAQAARGQRVLFASGGGRCEALLARNGVEHVRLEQSLRRPTRLLRAAVELARLCRRWQPDIIHAHMMSAAILGRIGGGWCGLPLVTTVHNSFDTHAPLMRLADIVVAVSRSERDLLESRGFPAARLRVVVNGTVGSARNSRAVPAAIDLPQPRIATMSGLDPRKGVHDVIDAFCLASPAAPQWHLVIAGEGPERSRLEQRARASSVGMRIRLIGHIDEPRALLKQTDIFVLASRAEPFGLGILEARQAGCAVVGTRVGGIADQLGDDRYGRIVPPGRPDLLADCLRRLLTDPAALARAQRDAGRDLDAYTVERMADDYAEVYEDALRARVTAPLPARAARQVSHAKESRQ